MVAGRTQLVGLPDGSIAPRHRAADVGGDGAAVIKRTGRTRKAARGTPAPAAGVPRALRVAVAGMLAFLAATATSISSFEPRGAAAATPVRIMPVGDSITEGDDGDATYRYFLWHTLLGAGHSVDFVGSFSGVKSGAPRFPDFDQDHSARSGWKAQRILGQIKSWTSANQPDVILLHIGTNDLRNGESNDSTETEIRSIIQRAREAQPTVTFLLAQLIPSQGFESQTAALNQRIAAVASSMTRSTSPVVLVDQYTGIDTTTDLQDGLHPNQSGDAKMAGRWYSALSTVLAVPSTTVPTIVEQPTGSTVTAGATASFSVSATGVPAPAFQWYRDGVALANAAGSSYTTPPTTLADSGASFSVVVSNSAGTVTSIGAVLTVNAAPGGPVVPPVPAQTEPIEDVYAFGDAPFFGSTGRVSLVAPIVAITPTPTGRGYWLLGQDGGLFAYGDATFFGSTGGVRLNRPVVGMASTPSGNGYWFVAEDGGIFAFGDARFFGSTGGIRLNRPIVGMARTASGNGYWLVASDGGMFAFGDAVFSGSTGSIVLNRPIVGMASTPSGGGYWLVASDGGIFAFGDARFFGSTGGIRLHQPIARIASTPGGTGYWMVAADGGIFAFGDAAFLGSMGGTSLNGKHVVGIAATTSGLGCWMVANGNVLHGITR